MVDGNTKSYYANSVRRFLDTRTDEIVGQLSQRVGLAFSGDEKLQIQAWRDQVGILKDSLNASSVDVTEWGILIELPLLRLGRRIDTILLAGDRILCLEFKVGAKKFDRNSIDQAVDYALCLRDFHAGSQGKEIVPIIVATEAPPNSIQGLQQEPEFVDGVSLCMKANSQTLSGLLSAIGATNSLHQLDWVDYDRSTYNPTPDIVTAARGIYAGHTVREIGRADANADALEATANELKRIANLSHSNGLHSICFVTGEPGSGKTLLGLDLVFSDDVGRVAGEPAALLSGNRPLVKVLQSAIALDMRARTGMKAKEAQRITEQGLQMLLGYLKDHSGSNGAPPENVIVFDEAQRAWDAATGKKLLDRYASEPEIFLEIMGRLPWACLVCLVGPGQEINTGEGGLGLWGEAIARNRDVWTAFASDTALHGAHGVSGLLDDVEDGALKVQRVPGLHLRTNLRAYRNADHGRWVEALLDSDIEKAAQISSSMPRCPAYITRDLSIMKRWLHDRRRGEQRVGMLASSGAVRHIAEGIPPSPRSNELDQVVHWFLKKADDYRSSNALEIPLSEFVCQGLEVDYVGFCWGNDLIWEDHSWVPRKMSAPNWQISRSTEAKQYRLNAYRVLLTRARAGMVIYVPQGDSSDRTRDPARFDEIYSCLRRSGCPEL